MKARMIPVAVAAIAIAAWPLSAAEIVNEVIVPTALAPAPVMAMPSLPGLAPVEVLFEETAPGPARQLVIPRTVPVLRVSPKSGKALFEANLVLMVGLNVADYVSTREALKYPGLTEVNPLMRPFVKSPVAFAAVKLGTTALSYLSMKAIFKRNKTVAWVMTTATNALLSFVVANNIRQIQGARAR